MSDRSSFQRFTGELRRRHVPQTVAVYLVMAWAAIEFADVIVPNLNGPAWVVTAVIVAAGVGLPAVLVLAWVFDWGPDGIHRTSDEPQAASPEETPPGAPPAPSFSAPWMMAVAVLVVGIGSAVAVAALLSGDGGDPMGGSEAVAEDGEEPDDRRMPDLLVPPGFTENPDSFRQLLREGEGGLGLEALEALGALGGLDTLDMGELIDLARRVGQEAGISVAIREPSEWRIGRGIPVPLAEGDTLLIEGAAQDSAGVVSVEVDGTTVARSEEPDQVLGFTGRVIGTGAIGTRRITIRIRTGDGRAITRDYEILQQPADRAPGGGSDTGAGAR